MIIRFLFVIQVPLTSMLEQYNTLRQEKEQDRQRQRVKGLRVTWSIKIYISLIPCLPVLVFLIY